MTEPNNVLLMTVSEQDFTHFKAMIDEVFSTTCGLDWVSDYDAGKEMIATQDHDLVLIDCRVGSEIALSLIGEVEQAGSHAPFLMLYDENNYETALDAMKMGASDALNKQKTTSIELKLSISHSIARQNFVTAERGIKNQLVKENHELSDICKTAQDFAGHVSHKIRTPLTVIKAFSAILTNNIAGQLNAKQTEYLKKIIGQTDRLNDLLTEMLENPSTKTQQNYSRAAGTPEVTPEGEASQKESAEQPEAKSAPINSPVNSENTSDNRANELSKSLPSHAHTALIVDDDSHITEVFTMLLNNLGLNVLSANSGRECLKQFALNPIDILILDLAIADDDGLNIYQKILDLEYSELENTPAILLTGSANEDIITRSSMVGAHYVLKNGDAWEKVQKIVEETLGLNGSDNA